MHEDFANMKTIGKLFGKTSHQVGRELRDAGYRDQDGKATKKALGEGFAMLQRNAEHREWIAVVWNKAKVCQLLEDFGWVKVSDE